MKKNNFFILLLTLTITNNAVAYLDPGTGNIIVQAIISSISVALGAVVYYWQSFINLFKFKRQSKTKKPKSSSDTNETPNK